MNQSSVVKMVVMSKQICATVALRLPYASLSIFYLYLQIEIRV